MSTWPYWRTQLEMALSRVDIDAAQRLEVIEACRNLFHICDEVLSRDYEAFAQAQSSDPVEQQRIADAIQAGMVRACHRLVATMLEVHASVAVELARAKRFAEPGRSVSIH